MRGLLLTFVLLVTQYSFSQNRGSCTDFQAYTTQCGGADPTACGAVVTGDIRWLDDRWFPNSGFNDNGGLSLYTSTYGSSTAPLDDPTVRCDVAGACTKQWTYYGTCTICTNGTANAGSNTSVCGTAQSGTMGGSIGGGATAGTWSGGSGSWASANSPANARYTPHSSEVGTTVTLTLTATGGCSTVSASKTITVNALPTAVTVSGAGAICSGESATLSASNGSSGTIYWQNTTTGGTSTATASTSQSVSSAGTYYFRAQSAQGCWGTEGSATVTVNSLPTAVTVSGGGAICSGETATLGASNGSSGTIYWQNTTTGGTSTATASTSQSVSSAGTYYFRAQSPQGCWGTEGSETVTVNSLPTAVTVSGGGAICSGESTSLTAANGGSGTIYWQNTTSGGTSTATASTSQSVSSAGTYYFRAQSAQGCWGTEGNATVTMNPDPVTPGSITGDANQCNATTGLTYSISAVAGATSYTWTVPSGWSITAGQNSTSITVTSGALGDDGNISVTSTNDCGTSSAESIAVNIMSCSNITDGCAGGGGTPGSISSSGGAGGGSGSYDYQWQSSTDNITFNNISGETSVNLSSPPSITVTSWFRRCVTSDECTICTTPVKAIFDSNSGAQPGGVNGPMLWLKADAGTSDLSTQWNDQSGNNNNYLQASATSTLAAGDSSSNYNPYIIISGGQGFTSPIALGSAYTMFVAAKKLSTDLTGTLVDGRSSNYSFAFSGNGTTKTVEVVTSSTLSANGVYPDINVGASNGNGCDAHLYELIIYNRLLPSDSIEIVESYLETKWGVDGADNYISSLGNSTYNTSSYANDIIGIGKECYFHQKQAQTEDDSVRITVSATKSIADMSATNSTNVQSITNDISYLMIGHDGAKLYGTSATKNDIPPVNHPTAVDATPTTILTRIDREWKITNTNFSDPVAIKFEVIPSGLKPDDLVFMVDDDGDFTDADLYTNGEGGVTIDTGSIIIGLPAAVIGAGFKIVALASKAPTSPLPVELLNFSVIKKDGYGLISWTTVAEINNSHFVVQKSVDGLVWQDIQVIQGAGNSNQEITYSAVDFEICQVKCYYRLQQVDFDGTSKLSTIRYIEHAKEMRTDLNIYPVPVVNEATVDFLADETAMYELKVYSGEGSEVYFAKVVCVEGTNKFNLNTNSYASGIYYLVITSTSGQVVNKVRFVK